MTVLGKPVELVTEGQVIVGKVCHVAPFGLFIELVPGRLDGLLRFESTPYPEIARQLKAGDSVEVVVRTVQAQQEAVYLALLEDPTRYVGFWPLRERNSGEAGAASDRPRG